MERIAVNELKVGAVVVTSFLVKRVSRRNTKSGAPYLDLTLGDKSGDIVAVKWDASDDDTAAARQGAVIKVDGEVQTFRDRPQLKVNRLRALEADEYRASEFLPASRFDPEQMYAELIELLDARLENPYVRRLLLDTLAEPELKAALMRSPAAKGMHHVFAGGLLEHVLSLIKLADVVVDHYRRVGYAEIYKDLVLAGLVFHDIGKVRELSPEAGFDYTAEGRLVGHLSIGFELLGKRMDAIEGFPPELAMHLKHLVLAHHGVLEFGSPVLPMTLEAIVVHYLDDLDSKVNSIHSQIGRELATAAEPGEFTPWHRLYERPFYYGHYADGFEGFGGAEHGRAFDAGGDGPESDDDAKLPESRKGRDGALERNQRGASAAFAGEQGEPTDDTADGEGKPQALKKQMSLLGGED